MTRRTCLILACLAAGATAASAQPAEEEASRYRTALSAVGGLSVGSARAGDIAGRFFGGSNDTGAAVGGTIAHDFSPRLTLEATGLYLDRASGAWSADLGFRLNLLPSNRSIVPYFAASGGVYSEDVRDGLGEILEDRDVDRNPLFPGRGGRAGMVLGQVGSLVSNARGDGSRTDGMVTLGGGAVFSAGSHVFVRPDVRAQLVFANDTRVLGLFALHFGYRF